jgi:serine/threonine protein kinase
MADVTEKLKDLANLLEKGLLSREEFDQQKRQLLAGSSSSGAPQGSSPNIGDSVGAYRILGELGQGGMGVVVRAKHRTAAIAKRQGGEVAIKVLHAQYAQDEVFRDRFEREASMGLKLDHPNIVKVHDLVIDGGNLALVMDLAAGRPLSEVIGQETGPIPWDRAWPMFKQMLDAVAYAHEHKVVHRDLKPENVILSPEGQLKVLDFGIAKDMEGGKTKTGTGMGTVDYMAPEQYTDASKVDQRADIYALGVTLYEMLAGRLPWEPGATEFQVMTLKSKGDFPPPTAFYPHIPPNVVEVVQKALKVEREARFSGVEAMVAALEEEEERRVHVTENTQATASPNPPQPESLARASEEPLVPSTQNPTQWVWGLILIGVVGFGLSTFLKTETLFKTETSFLSVSADWEHTCGVTSSGSVACWGADSYGRSSPPSGIFKSVSAGGAHTCGVTSSGSVACWGFDQDGMFTPPNGVFKSVSAASRHTCGVTSNGSVACWGFDHNGRSSPPSGIFKSVSAGGNHTCGVTSSGSVMCWGDDDFGQSTPPSGIFKSVSAGGFHTCGVKSDDSVACWGSDSSGESSPPSGVFKSVSAGGNHTCGVTSSGSVKCWGFDGQGRSTPPSGIFKSVSAGGAHTCGVTSSGSVACWGFDENGQSTPPSFK